MSKRSHRHKRRPFWRVFSKVVKSLTKLSLVINYFNPKIIRRRFRAGNLISRLLRPIFEIRKIRTVIGANLAGALVLGSLGLTDTKPASAYPTSKGTEVVINFSEPVITTETGGLQVPTKTLIGLSTRFQKGHAGLDLRAPLGSHVVPVNSGRVDTITFSQFGYGRSLIINHGNSLSSLYAHLGKINVKENQWVERDTIIAEVGLTGWTSGPHLHLEIYQDGVAVNPERFLQFRPQSERQPN
ncbi:hypothetical protein A2783_01395 [Microgenomates group bacterium RIFCSPHIGHO2_01_FULL_45_11]|nr:MAG: hypothetical protein A2783_01395 [Microgenomates group bacterium RIFCSPHIGHO2_01_FULL_45_11]